MSVPLIERFRDRLPVSDATPVVSLGEGSTPLLRAPRLSEELGLDLWLKLESANPTGSFKDRGMAVAVPKAVEDGAAAVVCASTGNTAASAAAYAARAGVRAVVLVPAGAVAVGKLAQARALGARVVEVRGSFDQTLRAALRLGDDGGYALVNSLNPYRLEGQKTAAFELLDELGAPPDVLALPYGGGGNTRAYHLGFLEAGAGLPRILAVAAADRRGTVGSAIRIAQPAHAEHVEAAVRASGGAVRAVSDSELLDAWRALGREGVFCEPASAAGIAGLAGAGLDRGTRVVCVITGHGLKDPDTAARETDSPVQVDADFDAIAAASDPFPPGE
ncbi:MAG TPA: threonine synthase [Gaiellaceae bacterium]|nr:threonine synthase [Gaiellaceae bacterium]